jgi:hypothetical protein
MRYLFIWVFSEFLDTLYNGEDKCFVIKGTNEKKKKKSAKILYLDFI